MVAVTILLVTAGFHTSGKNLILEAGEKPLLLAQISGYTQFYYLEESSTCPSADRIGIPDDESEFQWGVLRLKMAVKSLKTPIGSAIEIEALDLDDSRANWLRKAYLSYWAGDDWSFYVGRLFVAGGYTLPAPAALETVRFPRMPFSCYAHGVQAQGNLGSGFTVISDLTGRSGVSFDSDSNWDRLESSTRLQKKVTEDFFLAGTSNFSDDFLTLSLDSSIFLFEKLTVDHEIVDGKSDDNRTIAKLQIQF